MNLPAHLNLFQRIRMRGALPSHPPPEFLDSILYTQTSSSATKQGADTLPAPQGRHSFRTLTCLGSQQQYKASIGKKVKVVYFFLISVSCFLHFPQ